MMVKSAYGSEKKFDRMQMQKIAVDLNRQI